MVGAVDVSGTSTPPPILITREVMNWDQMEPQPGVWNVGLLNYYHYMIDRELCAGRAVIMVIVGTPSWASANGRGGAEVPRNLYLPLDDPQNYWGHFMSEISRKLKHKVDRWIIWNEPDIRVTDEGNRWTGSVEEFAQLHKIAYHAIKKQNPGARVHLASISQWYSRFYFAQLLDAFTRDPQAEQYGFYFDCASINLYGGVAEYHWLVSRWREIMWEHGLDKCVMVMEANFLDPPFSEDVQASWLVEAFAGTLGAGADGFFIYRWANGVAWPYRVSFGIEHKPLMRQAFATVTKYFSGPYVKAHASWQGALWRLVLEREDERITVLWNLGDTWATARVVVYPDVDVRIVDKYDEEIGSSRNGNVLSPSLPPAPAWVNGGAWVGGGPVIVVETWPPE